MSSNTCPVPATRPVYRTYARSPMAVWCGHSAGFEYGETTTLSCPSSPAAAWNAAYSASRSAARANRTGDETNAVDAGGGAGAEEEVVGENHGEAVAATQTATKPARRMVVVEKGRRFYWCDLRNQLLRLIA